MLTTVFPVCHFCNSAVYTWRNFSSAETVIDIDYLSQKEQVLMPARIVVADDHDVVRAGVRTILQARSDWTVCAEAADGQEALAQVKGLRPDIVVLDISMPSLNGLEAALKMRQSGCDTRILIFTMHDSGGVVRAAKEAGANGLVVKSFASRDLIRAVEALLAGETFFSADENKELSSTAQAR